MREIKFRGKANPENFSDPWQYGDLEQYKDILGVSEWTQFDIRNHELIRGVVTVYPESVGQFTGLKDKNGVEIYEGDVVSFVEAWDGSDAIGVIKWNEDHPMFCIKYGDIDELWIGLPEECQVIGKIYENPELMEAK